MAEPSLESTMSLTTQVSKIGFVEFTTDLVKNVYNVIVQASMDQLKQFADLVKDVSKPLGEYQRSLGLGSSDDPHPTTVTDASKSLLANCEKYATDVLGITGVPTSSTDPTIASYSIDGADFTTVKDKRNAVISDLKGIDFDPNTPDPVGTIEDTNTMPAEPTTAVTTLAIGSKTNLDKIIALKLRKGAEDNYNLLVTILKLGMQKIVVDKGLIATKLTFHVDAQQTESKATSNVNIKSKSFSLGGGVSGGFAKLGGRISGGYSNTNLSVSVVNEKSSAVANLAVDIVGEVRIEFRTDSFPSVNG
jgi:hypothetical protein